MVGVETFDVDTFASFSSLDGATWLRTAAELSRKQK
jgi:hypothetical protein